MSRVYLGTDHAGFELKEHLRAALASYGHDVVDCGALEYDAEDDYPSFCIEAARRAVEEGAFAVVLGGSGNGEQIAANKVPGARAALCWSAEIARLAREHNDANVCSLGARYVATDDAVQIVRTFLGTAFSTEPRHARRIAEIASYEAAR
jgi:ribose 5-phosphate isomerase B